MFVAVVVKLQLRIVGNTLKMLFRFCTKRNKRSVTLMDYSGAHATVTGPPFGIVRILPTVTIAIVIESKARDIDIFFMISFIPQTQYCNGCQKQHEKQRKLHLATLQLKNRFLFREKRKGIWPICNLAKVRGRSR